MSRYFLTEQAERDLNEIWVHIAEQSLDTADAVVAEIRAALDLLASSPRIGHRRKDVKDSRYRFWRANRFTDRGRFIPAVTTCALNPRPQYSVSQVPPFTRLLLLGQSHNVAAWPGSEITDHRGFDVDSWIH